MPNSVYFIYSRYDFLLLLTQQELSYRKQIARQLRTQYVEGIYIALNITP